MTEKSPCNTETGVILFSLLLRAMTSRSMCKDEEHTNSHAMQQDQVLLLEKGGGDGLNTQNIC